MKAALATEQNDASKNKINKNKTYNKYIFYFRNIHLDERKKKGKEREGREIKGLLLIPQTEMLMPPEKAYLES